MAKAGPQPVDEYIARQPQEAQAILRRVRGILRKALPGAEEVISYQIPAYRMHGTYVVYFAGWQEHYSLYPASDRLVAAFGDRLEPYRVSRGTIRFPLDEPVPVKLIDGIAKFLAKDAVARAAARPARPKKRGPATMGSINATWHQANRMPARATLDERVTWHLAHLKACACRSDLPATVRAELKRRGVRPPMPRKGTRAR